MVQSLLSLLSARQNSILSGASVLMITVFASKFLGLIRDRLLVHNFDTTQAAIFFAAFKLPDLIFQLLIFGALSVAFIPVFTDLMHSKSEKEAFNFASNILNLSLLFFGIVALICFVFVSPLNSIIIPGFKGEQKILTDQLTRVIMLGQVLLVIGAFFIGIAQSYQRFIIPSLAPLFYNLGIILGIVFFSSSLGIMGPAFGVVLGAALHVLIQLPMVSSLGFRYKLSLDFFNPGVREVVKLMSIRNIGLAVEQLSDTIGIALASLVSYSSVTLLTFAQHLQVVPIGLFGATIAQAALPVLSREHAKGETESFKVTLLTTMHQIFFLTLPAAAILIVLRIPVVRLVFGASQFSWEDTVLTGRTVAFLAAGVATQSVILLLVRGFYAFKDTKTPVYVSIFAVAINISLSLLFIKQMHLGVWSLGLSYAVSTNLSFFLLLYFLDQKVKGFSKKDLFAPALKMLLASLVAAIALYIPIKALDQLVFDTTKTINLLLLTGIASMFGLGIYLVLVWLMRVRELYTFTDLLKRTYRAQFKVKSEEIIKETGTV
ncbi:murein biosynthesis integral membrane protein MurJ [Candidatus Daviesbacteria bacterium]|nr:murein biosynthesis integral membrane protein MurJ [Candidatus Daviesbacteria bacterium]